MRLDRDILNVLSSLYVSQSINSDNIFKALLEFFGDFLKSSAITSKNLQTNLQSSKILYKTFLKKCKLTGFFFRNFLMFFVGIITFLKKNKISIYKHIYYNDSSNNLFVSLKSLLAKTLVKQSDGNLNKNIKSLSIFGDSFYKKVPEHMIKNLSKIQRLYNFNFFSIFKQLKIAEEKYKFELMFANYFFIK
jgi:hypothetical protein